MARWHYQGDINLEYGGTFIDLSEWKHDYVNIVEVTDLDSACGFRGAILVESKSVGIDRPDTWPQALQVIGCELLPDGSISDNGRSTYRKNSLAWKLCLVYALHGYGYGDTDKSETVQPCPDCPKKFDGWQATRIRSNGLRAYVRREFLGLAR